MRPQYKEQLNLALTLEGQQLLGKVFVENLRTLLVFQT